jgi:hypothetical protein
MQINKFDLNALNKKEFVKNYNALTDKNCRKYFSY